MSDSLLLKDESYLIVGACFGVHKDKGCGFLVAVYHECLAMEFAAQGISFVEQVRLQLAYKAGHSSMSARLIFSVVARSLLRPRR